MMTSCLLFLSEKDTHKKKRETSDEWRPANETNSSEAKPLRETKQATTLLQGYAKKDTRLSILNFPSPFVRLKHSYA